MTEIFLENRKKSWQVCICNKNAHIYNMNKFYSIIKQLYFDILEEYKITKGRQTLENYNILAVSVK